jgi:putative addiction module component (TIGR02574 family)
MNISQHQVFEFALALPQSDRADLAFQLLQSLEAPCDERSFEAFREDLHNRVHDYRQGKVKDYALDEVRAIVEQKLSEGRAS